MYNSYYRRPLIFPNQKLKFFYNIIYKLTYQLGMFCLVLITCHTRNYKSFRIISWNNIPNFNISTQQQSVTYSFFTNCVKVRRKCRKVRQLAEENQKLWEKGLHAWWQYWSFVFWFAGSHTRYWTLSVWKVRWFE